MLWLILGLALWSFTHYFKRLFPDARAALSARLGEGGSKGLVAVLLVLSVVLMTIGFRRAGYDALYTPPHWLHYVTIVINFVAILFVGAANSKSRLRAVFRHNMLMGLIILSAGHLLTSGEWRVIVLWGGLILYSVIQIRLINKAEPDYTPYQDGTRKGDIRLVLISAVLTAIIMGIHHWIMH